MMTPTVSRMASAGAGEIKVARGSITSRAAKEMPKPPFSLKIYAE